MKPNLIFFLIFLLTSNFIFGQSKVFVGYKNDKPVFDSFNENIIYFQNDERLEILINYPKDYTVQQVKENFICYIQELNNGLNIIINNGKEEIKYFSSTEVYYLNLDINGGLYFTNTKNEINYLKDGILVKTGLEGIVESVINNCLYFTKIHNPDLFYANVDLFEKDLLNSTKNPELILSNISGESLRIDKTGKYIYDKKLSNGTFKPFIYNKFKKKLKIIESIDKNFLKATPFFSYKKNELIFYNPNTMEFFETFFE
ncbi:hypothetical protein IU405_05415 [Polaribacter sp. BAL334]|uniref:hypothetical protein n=1 Tax=Polaribacter sp. BAL334 TaxID=1708178 RepID=UPI0018D2613F|nr:hypothetical protein [Polaribacter sp. BAL334]MBG7611684.1 hypothetical protein [Polaribacter sp. BAL334]